MTLSKTNRKGGSIIASPRKKYLVYIISIDAEGLWQNGSIIAQRINLYKHLSPLVICSPPDESIMSENSSISFIRKVLNEAQVTTQKESIKDRLLIAISTLNLTLLFPFVLYPKIQPIVPKQVAHVIDLQFRYFRERNTICGFMLGVEH